MKTNFIFTVLAIVFISHRAHAIRVGDQIVRQVSCRSGAQVDYLNTIEPGYNLTVRYQVEVPNFFSADMVNTGYREGRSPCPMGDRLELSIVKDDQISCSKQKDYDIEATEKMVDLNFKDHVEVLPTGGAVVGIPQTTPATGERSACPVGDTLLIQLTPIETRP